MSLFIEMFTKTFFDTTNPTTSYNRLFSIDILLSIIFHTLAYVLIIYIISKIFNINISSNVYNKVTIFLIITMILGYFGRLCRVKCIYNYLINNGYNKNDAVKNSMELLHKDYFKFYFLA